MKSGTLFNWYVTICVFLLVFWILAVIGTVYQELKGLDIKSGE